MLALVERYYAFGVSFYSILVRLKADVAADDLIFVISFYSILVRLKVSAPSVPKAVSEISVSIPYWFD